MWSDMYCGGKHCSENGPWSIWYDPEFDTQFSQSFAGLTWPRASVAGASLWHYVSTLAPTSAQFNDIITAHNARLTARGVDTCPTGCLCDWNSRCVLRAIVGLLWLVDGGCHVVAFDVVIYLRCVATDALGSAMDVVGLPFDFCGVARG